MADTEEHDQSATSNEPELLGEEASSAEYTPVVKLEEVKVATGEEDDDEIYKHRSALYRFAADSREWKERGRGDVKLLQNKNTKLIRILMRQDKTLKVCLNHIINPLVELQANAGSDRSWVWRSTDYAEEAKDETFALRFQTSDIAATFRDEFNKARINNESVSKGEKPAGSAASTSSTSTAAEPAADTTASSTGAEHATTEHKPAEHAAPAATSEHAAPASTEHANTAAAASAAETPSTAAHTASSSRPTTATDAKASDVPHADAHTASHTSTAEHSNEHQSQPEPTQAAVSTESSHPATAADSDSAPHAASHTAEHSSTSAETSAQ